LTQAAGQLVRDQALLDNARLDLKRYQVLVEQDSVAKQQLDTQEHWSGRMKELFKLDQGLVDNAKLQSDYSRITAPVSGLIGAATRRSGKHRSRDRYHRDVSDYSNAASHRNLSNSRGYSPGCVL